MSCYQLSPHSIGSLIVYSLNINLNKSKYLFAFTHKLVSKTTSELHLEWAKDSPVKLYDKLKLPQFLITNVSTTLCKETFHIGLYSNKSHIHLNNKDIHLNVRRVQLSEGRVLSPESTGLSFGSVLFAYNLNSSDIVGLLLVRRGGNSGANHIRSHYSSDHFIQR